MHRKVEIITRKYLCHEVTVRKISVNIKSPENRLNIFSLSDSQVNVVIANVKFDIFETLEITDVSTWDPL